MSDDEDTYERVGGVWVKKKGVFTAREWTFISEELSSNQLRECRDAVDCIEDPNDRARATSRVRGEPKIGQPRKWDSIDRAMRKWMIDPAVLLAHPEWVANNLVLNNGTAWGDATEPLDGATKKRKRGGGRAREVTP
ncbi:hypothetical protein FRC12_007134 [Ceratobasidium sp. 428]|nr:hypothetical protein FRC12_007134 [Ceratobasidium sp. 428]